MVSNWQTISLKNRKRIKIIASLFLAAALFLTGVTPSFADSKNTELKPSAKISWDDAPAVEGTSAILMDAGSGEILYEKNSHEKRDPASVTKILTCLVVLETMEIDQKVTSSVNFDPSTGGVGINIKKGEVFTVEQLLYALMLPSANDAAEVLAIAAGGSISNFCDMMNERAAMIGAEDTHFTNPNGLNGAGQENHRTTAYDLALIAREAMKNDQFRKIVSTVEYTIPATNMSDAREFINLNRCISDGETTLKNADKPTDSKSFRYEGTLGIKTGYTSTAGNCFCGWVQKDNTELVSVVLNSSTYKTRFSDSMSLWDYGFDKYYTYTAATAGDVLDEFRVKHGAKGEVSVTVGEDLDITLNKGYKSKGITTELTPAARKIEAPIKKGDEVGTITVFKDGKPVAEKSLYAGEKVEKGGILSYVGIPDEDVPKALIGIAVVLILLFVIYNLYRRYQYKQKKRTRARIGRDIRRKEWDKEKNPFD